MRFLKYLIELTQEYGSGDTSLNQVPAVHKKMKGWKVFKDGQFIVDLGGGKYNKGINYIMDQGEIEAHVHDVVNRSAGHNANVEQLAARNGGADIVIISNVLNVIKEREVRIDVLQTAKRLLKSGGTAYVSIYNAPKSKKYEEKDGWVGQPTGKGWQNCQPLSFYKPEVSQVFGGVSSKSSTLIAKK